MLCWGSCLEGGWESRGVSAVFVGGETKAGHFGARGGERSCRSRGWAFPAVAAGVVGVAVLSFCLWASSTPLKQSWWLPEGSRSCSGTCTSAWGCWGRMAKKSPFPELLALLLSLPVRGAASTALGGSREPGMEIQECWGGCPASLQGLWGQN